MLSEVTGTTSYAAAAAPSTIDNYTKPTYNTADDSHSQCPCDNTIGNGIQANIMADPIKYSSSMIVPLTNLEGHQKTPAGTTSSSSGRVHVMADTVLSNYVTSTDVDSMTSSTVLATLDEHKQALLNNDITSEMSKQLTSVLTRLEALEKKPQLPSPSSDISTFVNTAIDTKLSTLDSRVTAIDTSVSNLQNDSDSRLRSLENTLSAQTESLN